jgi:hypothetical protein
LSLARAIAAISICLSVSVPFALCTSVSLFGERAVAANMDLFVDGDTCGPIVILGNPMCNILCAHCCCLQWKWLLSRYRCTERWCTMYFMLFFTFCCGRIFLWHLFAGSHAGETCASSRFPAADHMFNEIPCYWIQSTLYCC